MSEKFNPSTKTDDGLMVSLKICLVITEGLVHQDSTDNLEMEGTKQNSCRRT